MEADIRIVTAVISVAVSGTVSIIVAVWNAYINRGGAVTSYTVSAINNWNSPAIIDARETLFVSMQLYADWKQLRQNTKEHNSCYVALSALDTIGYLIDKKLFDQKRFGGILERQATKLSTSAIKTWPKEIDNEFPHVRYLADMRLTKKQYAPKRFQKMIGLG